MGDVLAELEDVLRSKTDQEKLSAREEMVLQACKARAIRDFVIGACVSSAVTWAATTRLKYGQRFNLSVGSAMFAGMWKFNRSLNSCLDQLLGLEGSRIQRELARIILIKHHDNASRVKLVRKHFYQEQVIDDLNPDRTFFRWHSRYFYSDNNEVQKAEYHDNPNSSSFGERPDSQQPKQFPRSEGGDMIADPLDCVFGHEEASGKEIAGSDSSSNVPPRRRLRANKRAHRRHRARHYENSPDGTTL